MSKSKNIVSAHMDFAALAWATRGLTSDMEWANWARTFVESLATGKPELNDFAASLIQKTIDFRAEEAKRLQMLREKNVQNVPVQSVQGSVQTERKKEEKEERVKKERTKQETHYVADATDILKNQFNEARKAYPGITRGLDTEWKLFRSKHGKRAPEIIPLLLPAIERWIAWRKWALSQKIEFLPNWKNFKTWINGSHWEDETPKEITVK